MAAAGLPIIEIAINDTLLAHTLGEEESSDYLLTALTKPLMQQAS